jgi:tetratricopeptide (TPR) repeat protein
MDDVIRVLSDAVDADSANPDLRAYLAHLLAEKGRTSDGLECAQQGLVTNPAHLGLLSIAAETAQRLGLGQEAKGYTELLTALGYADEADIHVPDSFEELMAGWSDTEPPGES